MRIAFTAWTPLHIINIINTQQTFYSDETCDLFIYDEFQNAGVIYQRIKEGNFFERVFLVRNGNDTSKCRKIYEVLLNDFSNYLQEQFSQPYYDVFFIQGDNYFSKLLYAKAKQQNPSLELNYLEDGMGIYINPQVLDKDSRGHRYYSKLNRHSIYLSEIKHHFVYEPRLVELEASFKQLPKLTQHNSATDIINHVFGLSNKKNQITDEIIFIEQPFEHELINIDQELLLEFIQKYQSNREIKVKLHPRTLGERFNQRYKVIETSLPWELFLLNAQLTNTLIVTVISTAAFTPYLLFGSQQETIFLSEVLLSQKDELKLNQKTSEILKRSSDLVRRFNVISKGIVSLPSDQREFENLLNEK